MPKFLLRVQIPFFAMKIFKPLTPSLRQVKLLNYKNIFIKKKYLKTSIKHITRHYGHNNKGRLTSYHKGGGHKRLYRLLNNTKLFDLSIIEGFEYDPFRSAFLMRLFNPLSLSFCYQIAPQNIKIGNIIRFNTKKTTYFIGSTTLLKNIPIGSFIYNLSFHSNNKTKLATSAGMYAQIIQHKGSLTLIKLKSGQFRYFPNNVYASIGRVSNVDHRYINYGKAGRIRWLNKRPTVRGVAMNPIDHPHGGGAGKTSSARPCCTPWGKLTRGVPTRNLKKNNIYYISNRSKK